MNLLALMLAATVYAGVPCDSLSPCLEWRAAMPMTNDAGTCRKPQPVPSLMDSVTCHWRTFHLFDFPAPNWWMYHDDSVKLARTDTLTVTYPVRDIRYYVRYAWVSRWGVLNGPVELFSCAKSKVLIPRVP
jgi:hypothetical protein